MKIAIVGCIHGELNRVYDEIENYEKQNNLKISLLLICGDFQSVRNEHDLICMAVPQKYKQLGDFHSYFSGEKKAPVLTLFIGGNHEASNYLQTLPYGGWVANNIYYMGYASIIKFNGVRIGGISGVYKKWDKDFGHFEHLPYNDSTLRSVYHTRYLETFRMVQVKEKLDIMLSHDWPLHVYNNGNVSYLIRKKPFFKKDIDTHQLGSPMHEMLLNKLKPNYWFSAHLHVKFKTTVRHKINKDLENRSMVTEFLALDKCLPRRGYLEFIDIESVNENSNGFEYDLEWLAILKKTDVYFSIDKQIKTLIPKPHIILDLNLDEEIKNLKCLFEDDFKIPFNFSKSLPINEDGVDIDPKREQNFINPQTQEFCKKFNLRDPISMLLEKSNTITKNNDEINISDDDDEVNDVNQTDTINKKFKQDDENELFFIDKVGGKK